MGEDTKNFMAMKGAGYYSRATIGAKHVMDNAAPLVLDAIDRMGAADDGSTFRATDMGAADGGTSLDLWRTVLSKVRTQMPSRPIELIYTDLPKNDFSQTFQITNALAEEIADVHVLASGTSFHDKILPANTLDLGFSSTASHYITDVPCAIRDHVHMVGASPLERTTYAQKGAQDWAGMLTYRAAELKPGGRLCLFNFGIDEEGCYLGATGGVNMFDTFATLWAKLRDDGVITSEEFINTNFPQCYRNEAEFTAPFEDPESAPYKAGLRLEHTEARVVRCPFEEDFTENHKTAAQFAESYIPTLRSWSEPTFASGLDVNRSSEECIEIIDAFYRSYQDMVAANPEGHAMDYVHVYLVARKEV